MATSRQNRRFDGYKTHASVDPDSELIDEVDRHPGEHPDRDAVDDLLGRHADGAGQAGGGRRLGIRRWRDPRSADQARLQGAGQGAAGPEPCWALQQRPLHDRPRRRHGDLSGRADRAITPSRRGGGKASFAAHCAHLPAAQECTAARQGRSITIHRHEASSRPPAPSRPPPNGSTPTGPTARSSNARSRTSPAGCGVAARPDVAAWPASPPTSTPEPPPSTWRASPSSASASTAPLGRPAPVDLHPSTLSPAPMPRSPKRSPYEPHR